MTIFDIILKSLGRQKSKKLFLLIAIVLSFATVLILYTFTLSQTLKIENQFDEYGANIIITPKTDTLALNYGGINFSEVVSLKEISKSDLTKIQDIHDINSLRAIAPKLIGSVKVLIGDVISDVVIVGTDFSAEFKIGNWLDSNDSNTPHSNSDVIIGWDVADKLKLKIQDSIIINDKTFNISKVLDVSGGQDDGVIIADLEVVEELLDKKGRVSLVEVSALCSECPIETIVAQISEVLPDLNVRAMQDVLGQRMIVVDQVEKFAITITLILILLCSLLIFSSMASSVNERSREIGIFIAIGFSKVNIITIIQGEALILTLISGLIGVVISIIVSYIGLPLFAGIESSNIVFDYLFFIKGTVVLLIIGLFSSLLPSLKAAKTDPVKTISSL